MKRHPMAASFATSVLAAPAFADTPGTDWIGRDRMAM